MFYGQDGTVIGLLFNVTVAVRANNLPFTFAPFVTVMEALAMMVPAKFEKVPSVAEVPTCQNTSWAEAPPARMTWLAGTDELPAAVVRVDTIWKIYVPWPARVRFPVIPREGCALVVL
jgi:hypothetical protein